MKQFVDDKIIALEEQLNRYKNLLHHIESFHSKMNIGDVINQLVEVIGATFPSYQFVVLLANNATKYSHLNVEEFVYDADEISSSVLAFMTGNTQTDFEDGIHKLYVPLKGKQGVYGVLKLSDKSESSIGKEEKNFLIHIVNAAGIAMENAKLFEQSHKLISDLQMLNELSHDLNSSQSLSDTVEVVSKQIQLFMGAEEIGFIIYEGKDYQILKGSTAFFSKLSALQYIQYIDSEMKRNNEGFFAGNCTKELTVVSTDYQSVMAAPMIQSGEQIGLIIVLHQQPYRFSFDSFKLLQSLIHHTTLAIRNLMLREELEHLVITDHLTKLYSRKYLDESIGRSMKIDEKGTFLLMDIDNFKRINDTYGHQTGDQIIIQISKILKDNIRNGDVAARWGGEELAIYLPNVSLEIGTKVANRILKNVESDTYPKTTISCGISYWATGTHYTMKQLFNEADKALYAAKKSGKNKYIISN